MNFKKERKKFSPGRGIGGGRGTWKKEELLVYFALCIDRFEIDYVLLLKFK
jgi:hypothetical protein